MEIISVSRISNVKNPYLKNILLHCHTSTSAYPELRHLKFCKTLMPHKSGNAMLLGFLLILSSFYQSRHYVILPVMLQAITYSPPVLDARLCLAPI